MAYGGRAISKWHWTLTPPQYEAKPALKRILRYYLEMPIKLQNSAESRDFLTPCLNWLKQTDFKCWWVTKNKHAKIGKIGKCIHNQSKVSFSGQKKPCWPEIQMKPLIWSFHMGRSVFRTFFKMLISFSIFSWFPNFGTLAVETVY